MEEIVNLIANDASATDISDKMKDLLFAKAAVGIDAQKADIAAAMFDTSTPEPETSEEE